MPIRQVQVRYLWYEKVQTQLTGNTAVPTTHLQRTNHDYGYDVFAKCGEVLREAQIGERAVA